MLIAISILLAAISGCAIRSAPEIKGRWKPVNRFPETTEAIPLRQSYMYYPSPMDGTLKAMLARWARDSDLTLTYLHPDDFTLHRPVTNIRTGDLQEAVSLLTRIYAAQRVAITASKKEIVVKADEPDAAVRTPDLNETSVTK